MPPYGTWPSPLSAAHVAAQGVRLSAVSVDGNDIYWIEGRPADGGRQALVRRSADGTIADVTPADFNVRSHVHEYGGGAYTVDEGDVYFSNFADGCIYLLRRSAPRPVPLTREGPWCYADVVVDRRRRRLICVREDHSRPGAVENALVSIAIEGGEDPGQVIASGYDFYSTPRLSPDGSRLAWLAWRHPQMPWDGTELWVASVTGDGTLAGATRVAGSDTEAIYQPGWSPEGELYFVSDRDGWWMLYGPDGPAIDDPPLEAEFGRPQWVFGTASWAFAGPRRLAAAFTQRGRWHLAAIDLSTRTWRPVPTSLEPHEWFTATPTAALMVAGTPVTPDAVVSVDLESGAADVLRSSAPSSMDPRDISVGEAIEFPTSDGDVAHGFYYPPRCHGHKGPVNDSPPLIAIGHGGPTTATSRTLDLRIQYWTTRGIGVVDVNYRGSSGYGRRYRRQLEGRWGIADVADMVNAARHLVSSGRANPHRLIVRGGSAGGYTALAALTFHPGVFTAGASYYGISDLEVLARDTHKFESRYLDRLVGPYPAARDVYRARSPLHFVERLLCPLIVFQGLDDRVVPPNQSELLVAALRDKGMPVAYLQFVGEQHGFRRADTIVRSLEAELYFYGRVFGFTPADPLEPVPIDNLR
jgi:dipeptidyl aminopeptidase/acylaminoacyl peptidase